MNINTPLFADGSLIFLQSSGTSPTIYFDSGLYVVHELQGSTPPASVTWNEQPITSFNEQTITGIN